MKILAIRGHNLASLADAFEIRLDRPPLSEAGLFAIAGRTGAGKSTLLDAICLALFDRIPRLDGARPTPLGHPERPDEERINANDARGILRRGAAVGYAEVEFRGSDGQRYRARWSVRRARGRSDGRLQSQSVELHHLDRPDETFGGSRGDILAAIQARLGLTFDQFRRSVLLAQGDFAALLRSPARERAELLERITGTEIYGQLSRAAHRRAGDEKARLTALERQLESLHPLEAEARAELNALIDQTSQRLETADRYRQDLAQAQDWYRTQTRLRKQLDDAHRERMAADAAVQTAEPRHQALQRIRALEPLRVPLRLHERAAEAVARVARDWSSATGAIAGQAQAEQQAAALDQAETDYRQVQERARDAAPRIQAARALDTRIQAARDACKRLEQDRSKAEQLRQKKQREAADLTKRWEAATAGVEAARQRLSLIDAAHLNALRARLRDGEPCPLCGAEHHPWALDPASPTAADEPPNQTLTKARRQLEELDARARQLEETQRQADIAARTAANALEEGTAAVARASAALAELEQERAGCLDGRPAEALETELAAALTAAETRRQGAQTALASAREALTAARTRCDALQRALEQAQAEQEHATQALAAGMAGQGIELAALREALAHDAAWVEREARELAALREAVERARTLAEERARRLAEHQSTGAPALDQVAAGADETAAARLLAAADAALEQSRQTLADAQARRAADDDRIERSRALRNDLERQRGICNRWESLRQLIGSSDGARFRNFAQTLTLELLIDHANEHLADLARRYRLLPVPGAGMELQVIDRDLGDEVRGIHSLSGGETFLVSLAMALGLASLASDRIRIESLFIDEGFGALDAESLDLAIASLDALQGLGRQVGVISHVGTLVERIGVRVEVRKGSGGHSQVAIVAG